MAVLAVVPARGGSKSIPRKNLQEVGGKSLVARAAEVAAALPWLDAAVISTDDDEIMAEAVASGLDAPFRRPAEHAGDAATSAAMWRHAWLAAEDHYEQQFDISVLLEPTSPLRRPRDVDRTVAVLLAGSHSAAATVSPTPAHYTPHKALILDEHGIVGFYLPDGARYNRRQTIPRYYHRNGLCYALTREALVDRGHIIEEGCAALVVERHVVNIDEPFELELAEFLLARDRSAAID